MIFCIAKPQNWRCHIYAFPISILIKYNVTCLKNSEEFCFYSKSLQIQGNFCLFTMYELLIHTLEYLIIAHCVFINFQEKYCPSHLLALY